MIRIVIADDHPLFREGVIRSLSERDDFEVVGEGSSVEDAIRLAAAVRPDILLLDLSMPGGGLNAIAPLLQANSEQKIVVLTVSEASEDVSRALKAGAKGYILKGVGSDALSSILRRVANGESYVAPDLSDTLVSLLTQSKPATTDPFDGMTTRESQILRLVARGQSNKQVAAKLDLQEKTVKHHMTRILAKLGVSNRTEAAIAVRDSGVMLQD